MNRMETVTYLRMRTTIVACLRLSMAITRMSAFYVTRVVDTARRFKQ